MTVRIINELRELFPDAAIGREPVSHKGRAVTVRSRPLAGSGARRTERVTLRFIAPSYDEARRMYLAARKALVSVGNEPSVGEGENALIIRESGGEAPAGYAAGTGIYRITAAFTVTGF